MSNLRSSSYIFQCKYDFIQNKESLCVVLIHIALRNMKRI